MRQLRGTQAQASWTNVDGSASTSWPAGVAPATCELRSASSTLVIAEPKEHMSVTFVNDVVAPSTSPSPQLSVRCGEYDKVIVLEAALGGVTDPAPWGMSTDSVANRKSIANA